jgi:hypothetical protein
MVRSKKSAIALALLALSAVCSCSKKPANDQKGSATPAVTVQKKPAVLIGTVRLEGGELPTYSPEQMERQVLAHAKGGSLPDVCSPPKLADRTPVSLTADGKLVGVMLAASDAHRRHSAPRE